MNMTHDSPNDTAVFKREMTEMFSCGIVITFHVSSTQNKYGINLTEMFSSRYHHLKKMSCARTEMTCVTRKQTLRSLSLSCQKKDGHGTDFSRI